VNVGETRQQLSEAKTTIQQAPFREVLEALARPDSRQAIHKVTEAGLILLGLKNALPSDTVSAFAIKEKADTGTAQIQAAVGDSLHSDVIGAILGTKQMSEEADLAAKQLDAMETALGNAFLHLESFAESMIKYELAASTGMEHGLASSDGEAHASDAITSYLEELR
jgi:aminopeptidase N